MGSDTGSSKPLTYSSYLKIDELLSLQQPRSGGPGRPAEHDETLFIVIHQVYELWFKQVLHELTHLQRSLDADDGPTALDTFKRILTILKTLVGQVDVLETMTPVQFSSFRTRLDSASGFQSAQFREVEFVLGKKRQGMARHHPEGSPGRDRLEALLDRPTLWDSFLGFLARRGYPVPEEQLGRDLRAPIEPSPEVQEILLAVYRGDHLARQMSERMVDLDEGIQEWRYRHVKMVERTIGAKPGTGGSPGAEYLRKTLFEPLFPDLWEVRSRL
ncbi:MAG TPA: tryptophan 2,3-dioxygenase family protein [Thermoanaerobaculia bacterium]|nr:tryptophan 2,3-dioxygenase family protein [Thermoanaerobaculia bacterium]